MRFKAMAAYSSVSSCHLRSTLGFDASMIAGLVDQGLATLTVSKVWAGGKMIEVGRVRIKAAGRKALVAEC